MIQKKIYFSRILELILTSIVLTLAVVLQEASWLNDAKWSSTSEILVEQMNHR